MGTSSVFVKNACVPGVSGLSAGRLVSTLHQLAGSGSNALSVFAPGFNLGRARCEGRSWGSSVGLANGAGVAGWGGGDSCRQVRRSLATQGEKKRGCGARRGVMKQKRSNGAAKSDGVGLMAGEVEVTATFEAESYQDKCGSIHLILGPMFAGKSTALLKRAQEEASAGRRVALVKSDKDSRYGLSAVVTHDGLQMPCYAVPDFATFKAQVGDKLYKEFDVIGIDEAQFFTDLYDFCLTAADYEGKTVIAAGLDGDFLRRKFGSTVDLVRVADTVVKLASRCEICGKPALFTFRKTLDIQTTIIGGADVYMPVCRQHYVGGQLVVDSACTVLEAHQAAHSRKDC
ncbi:thymidine kinase [Marchantia polymorpha subsp. ruderalis]|uniref:thymidine kinase n=2 Tax=Marchantia polymorpha TaxID=3197 RepID=A0AAF6AVX6_MARPO|nr:hypothetical protein MARPO_0007s0053 [Marchantia polymorpha]BBN03910.1 hypothetical protein Mp_3g00570 [Marchantia polymorpha subsp. ruderalis]|eukprot:PTQ47598.1 hypothetical protein MARPO_0007s0053 [Marchantia polymorpha]